MHRFRGWLRGCRGALLMETVVAITVFMMLGTTVLAGLSTSHISGAKTEAASIAENLARNQMEYIFSLAYQESPTTYPAVAMPSGYSVTAVPQEYVAGDLNIEKVTVTISHNSQQVFVVETLRTR